ncbi:MAG: thiamine pyrophosphate-dependent dehydrogenase E1 component subunit alpha [Candidatus Omnitrophica bacterium]|nr:thiamine pyrophosphate-dependent dehydrogenase E1 component subunit alpha [Candidatus Omnitrophota bacterium]
MAAYSKKFLKGLYTTMLRIRFCEESMVRPITKGEIRCPVHLYTGQEAIAAGVSAALGKGDYVFSGHRSHGHFIARGGKMKELIAEVYGRSAGCSKGRGGSMHICDNSIGMPGTVPIVAGIVSLALGSALASKINKDNKITVVFFGDGATGGGVLYESLNFAALKKLPIVFVCENNFYSTHLPIKKCRPDEYIYKIAKPFGIQSSRVDGNKVLEVYEAAKKAIGMTRQNKGPVFIEFVTYRMRGHVGPDDNIQGYHTDIRTQAEIERWRKKDPIADMEKLLAGSNMLGREGAEKIKKDVRREIKKAYSLAKKSPLPAKNELTDYVFRK